MGAVPRFSYVADDFGMNVEVNDAVLRGHDEGALTAASLMMGQPGTDHAICKTQARPTLSVGIHFHLCDSQPVNVSHWPWGKSPLKAGLQISASPRARALITRELIRQWDEYNKTGLSCDFINFHHHLHHHPFVYQILLELIGDRFAGWIRLGSPKFFAAPWNLLGTLTHPFYSKRRTRFTSPDSLWGVDRLCKMSAQEILTTRKTLPKGWHEFMFHPRKFNDLDTQCLLQLKTSSSF